MWQPYIISIVPSGDWNGVKGKPFKLSLSANGGTGPYHWSVIANKLPPGLTLDESSGVISGNPTQTGRLETVVKVTDANGVSNGQEWWIFIY